MFVYAVGWDDVLQSAMITGQNRNDELLRPIAQSPLQFLASEFEHIEEPMSSLMFGPDSTPVIEDPAYQRFLNGLNEQGIKGQTAHEFALQYVAADSAQRASMEAHTFPQLPPNVRAQANPVTPEGLGWTTTTTKPWVAPFPLLSLRAASS